MAAVLLQSNKLSAGTVCRSSNTQKRFVPAFSTSNKRQHTVKPFTSHQTAPIGKHVIVTQAARQVVAVADLMEDEDVITLPQGYEWYETMLILKPTLSDPDRDKEIAKFEAFLNKEECLQIDSFVRGRCRMAYPMKSHWEGIYVLYTYAARKSTAKSVQLLLSTPDVGSEDTIMRFMTLRKTGRR